MLKLHKMLLTGLLLLLIPVVMVGASTSPKIASVELKGAVSVTEASVLFYLQIKEGEPYDPAKIKKNFPALINSHLFSDVRITEEEKADGIHLTVTVVERPILKEISYEKNKALSDRQIQEKFSKKKILFRKGSPLREDLINRAKAVIEDAYKELGYPNAKVEAKVEKLEKNECRLTFTVDEGTKLRISKIIFEGNTVFSDRKLRRKMKKTKKWNWISAVSKHGIYNKENVAEDLKAVRKLYLKHGYKDIKIGEPEVKTISIKKGKKRGVIMTIPLEEGNQFRIRNVSIEGSTVYPAERLMKMIKLSQGKILNFQQLQDAQDGIGDLYSSRGYLFAKIVPDFIPVEGEENVVDVKLHMEEGDQYHLGRVEFTGNTRTQDKVLRRELLVYETGVFNAPSFRRTVFRLNQLGYFKMDEEKPVDFKFNPEEKTVDVVVNGHEAARNDIQFSFGYSELDGFFGQIYFNTRNFLGRGETLTLGLQKGRRRDYYELVYSTPWFLDKPHILTASIYSRTLDYIDFDRESKGFSFGYGIRLGPFTNISLVYNRETITANWGDAYKYKTDEEGNRIPNYSYQDVDATSSSITPIFSYDGRDDPYDPFKGWSVRASVKYSGGGLGGEIDLIKPMLQFTLYHPTSRHHTFAAHTEYGQIYSTKGEIPFYERFFLGGERSLRGFTTRSVRPEDPVKGIIGGSKYMLFNLESIWKVQGPFRMVLFLDAGQAYGEWESLDLGRLRYSTGAEMRIFIPTFMAPLRFIYGINLDPEPGESKSDFQFTIGTNF